MVNETLPRGTQILYVPDHADSVDHPDIECGFIWVKHYSRTAYLCRFWREDKRTLRTLANSEVVSIENIVVCDSVPDSVVREAIRKIEYGD